MNFLFTDAYNFARIAHAGQVSMDGSDYIQHALGVSLTLRQVTGDVDIIAAGLLHDTMKSDIVTPELIEGDFNKRIADLVLELHYDNNNRSELSKREYVRRSLMELSDDALLIRLADFAHEVSFIGRVEDERFKKKKCKELLYITRQLKILLSERYIRRLITVGDSHLNLLDQMHRGLTNLRKGKDKKDNESDRGFKKYFKKICCSREKNN